MLLQVALRLLTEGYRQDTLDELLGSVKGVDRRQRLLTYVRQWNTKSKLAEVAAALQNKLLMAAAAAVPEDDQQAKLLAGLQVDGLRAFDKKHYDRVTALSARLAIVDALLQTN